MGQNLFEICNFINLISQNSRNSSLIKEGSVEIGMMEHSETFIERKADEIITLSNKNNPTKIENDIK